MPTYTQDPTLTAKYERKRARMAAQRQGALPPERAPVYGEDLPPDDTDFMPPERAEGDNRLTIAARIAQLAEARGWTAENIADKNPRALTTQQVQRVLDSGRSDGPTGGNIATIKQIANAMALRLDIFGFNYRPKDGLRLVDLCSQSGLSYRVTIKAIRAANSWRTADGRMRCSTVEHLLFAANKWAHIRAQF